ncbi:hypothetical protein PUR49_01150 [Streptomyces sp. BE147]|uniref:hypothetical protein n=1 Tax=unclassified Streptomyces TaxID=2593676 RepID=UPI00224DA29B|nr:MULTISPECIES: hypothetical protein [unclassified Streptomyces]MCX4970830.1 hypothetical protein [Streptomyces sp. NBC_00654]MEE1735157.1 hypothetical protein [Streptomyces sp. BE147]
MGTPGGRYIEAELPLSHLTRNGDYAYCLDIAHFMAGLPHPSPVRWLEAVTGCCWPVRVL